MEYVEHVHDKRHKAEDQGHKVELIPSVCVYQGL